MTILLTGKNGQLGFELQRTLAPLGDVVAVDVQDVDLADATATRDLVRRVRPGLIANAAAYTAVDRAEDEPDLARAINAVAPGVLAEEAERLGATMVHFSTDYVFDGAKGAPYVETDTPAPVNVYGATKLAGDQAALAGSPRCVILRVAWLYAMRGRNFLLTMRRLAEERDELRVVADQTGAPTWARLVAEAAAQVAYAYAVHGVGEPGVYHLPAAGATSWHGFAEAIVERHALAGGRRPRVVPIATHEYPTPARRPAYSVLDGAKISGAFGITLPRWERQLDLAFAGGGSA
jgi:dTDP-4-dehydrorhamnose reductase